MDGSLLQIKFAFPIREGLSAHDMPFCHTRGSARVSARAARASGWLCTECTGRRRVTLALAALGARRAGVVLLPSGDAIQMFTSGIAAWASRAPRIEPRTAAPAPIC
jgi:hypothetical protein